jgi:hypothetical protein
MENTMGIEWKFKGRNPTNLEDTRNKMVSQGK